MKSIIIFFLGLVMASAQDSDLGGVIEYINDIPVESNHYGLTTHKEDGQTFDANYIERKCIHKIIRDSEGSLLYSLILLNGKEKRLLLSGIVELRGIGYWEKEGKVEVVDINFEMSKVISMSKYFKSTDSKGNREISVMLISLSYDYESGLFLGNSLGFTWGNIVSEKIESFVWVYWNTDGINWNEEAKTGNFKIRNIRRSDIKQ